MVQNHDLKISQSSLEQNSHKMKRLVLRAVATALGLIVLDSRFDGVFGKHAVNGITRTMRCVGYRNMTA